MTGLKIILTILEAKKQIIAGQENGPAIIQYNSGN